MSINDPNFELNTCILFISGLIRESNPLFVMNVVFSFQTNPTGKGMWLNILGTETTPVHTVKRNSLEVIT